MPLLLLDRRRVEQVRCERGLGRWGPALARLGRDADRAGAGGPWSVTAKTLVPPSGDRRDYCTLSEYFWPDPSSADGLPWVLRDGHINPDATSATRDADHLRHMAHGARTLALAGWLNDDQRLVAEAAGVIHHWFLDPATSMRPHLRFASLIPGRDEPPDWGLIRAHPLIYAVEAAAICAESGGFEEHDREGLRTWFGEFLAWIQASSMWQAELERGNNHTTWCLALGLALAMHVGDNRLTAELSALVPDVIEDQVDPDGRQTRELERSRSYFYSCFNLDGLCTLADLATAGGVDCWSSGTGPGRRLRAAARWLTPWLENPDRWPLPFHIEWDRTHGASPLHRVVARCHDAVDLRSAIGRVPVARHPSAREWLLWDTGVSPEPR